MSKDHQKLESEIRCLCAALRDARWQLYHLFTVQRQRAWHADEREKALRREFDRRTRALKRLEKNLTAIAMASTSRRGLAKLVKIDGPTQRAIDDFIAWKEGFKPADIRSPEDRSEDLDEDLSIPLQTPTVDIVVCIHNALDDVKICLDATLHRSPQIRQLILVNDGSDEATSQWLQDYIGIIDVPVQLIHNPEQRGYTIAANQGLRASPADYVVLLNSDTIPTRGWLERLIACGESDPDIAIVGPLSNAASWQSVPRRFAESGDWEVNELPSGISPDDVAAQLALHHQPEYPRTKLINGFCLAIKRSTFNKLGYFDEETFPRGYGEENDFCLRAIAAGLDLAVADDCYVFHAKSKSFTHEKRLELVKNADKVLHQKHKPETVELACDELRENAALARVRERFANLQKKRPPFSILYLLPLRGTAGGIHSVIQEAVGLRQRGVFAQVAIRLCDAEFYHATYPAVAPEVFYIFDSKPALIGYADAFDVAVATQHGSIGLLSWTTMANPALLPAYYVQDYEPNFYPASDAAHHHARESYTRIPGAALFAKTEWIREKVTAEHGVEVHKVTPSIDHEIYRPDAEVERTVDVCAMIRPSSSVRSPELTADVLTELGNSGVKVAAFGSEAADAFWQDRDFPGDIHGVLRRDEVADLLRSSRVFIDLSEYQAFGRTGLEAMACGCAAILPEAGGSDEYAVDDSNCLRVDSTDRDATLSVIRKLLDNDKLRSDMVDAGLKTAQDFSVDRAAESIETLFTRLLAAK